jgi:hypothetical protein
MVGIGGAVVAKGAIGAGWAKGTPQAGQPAAPSAMPAAPHLGHDNDPDMKYLSDGDCRRERHARHRTIGGAGAAVSLRQCVWPWGDASVAPAALHAAQVPDSSTE